MGCAKQNTTNRRSDFRRAGQQMKTGREMTVTSTVSLQQKTVNKMCFGYEGGESVSDLYLVATLLKHLEPWV